ncbi:hypothetical protein AKJ51_03050 [candidate division MSBL1 archaeon SCGC-AAA382A20]|uniref:Cob(I)yrinic acid a c-diamide adenosyltransferase n=1 Tax=candidate division MSBL1 archaeon SCGC-AAA382A20 TaxID=1698280 RepID=A0A133VJW9_9EURY|nr:hypothetical protein AKJ51_03050 [candidate division MSBL1 archaeon SCGC-AAA382A20]
MNRNLIHIYTGSGSKKTNAAVGLTIRALSHGLKVGFVYFNKDLNERGYEEFELMKSMGVEVKGFAEKHQDFQKEVDRDKIRREFTEGLNFVKDMFNQSFDLIVLDEIIIAVQDGFLKGEEILELLDNKPPETELILTGLEATDALIDRADLVSRVEKVK